ncbi:MAG: VacJ family lipoprotein [Burkholderiaceae bacterium]|jgi:phospholipid-binding lipoprotein MlaA|nr:VacJ family lipoprotein [Burkholderiaceae bacterium]
MTPFAVLRPTFCRRALPALAVACLLAGCASAPGADPRDPWEPYNRSMTRFNTAVDNAALKPAATFYQRVTPSVVRTGVGNFFGNLGDVWSFVNNVLQAKPEGSLYSFWRVVVNTTIGLGGVLDPATDMRLTRHSKDFGQTLGYWGIPSGPYVVLPLLGPSTLRDTAALPVDWYGQPLTYVSDVPVRNTLMAVHFVDTRARLLGVSNMLEQSALDPYSFQRDVFLQLRRNQVYDGNPPPDPASENDAAH